MNFDQWWATKAAAGYQYGPEELESVRMGFEGAQAIEERLSLYGVPEARNAAIRARDYCHEADELLRALDFDPKVYRTEGGALNLPKIKAALAHPQEYPRTDEPKAWMFPRRYGSGLSFVKPATYRDEDGELVEPTPLYTKP